MAMADEERRPVPISRRPVDLFLASFLLMNIPVVLLFESQVVVPASFVPKPLRDLTQQYVEFAGDFLVGQQPAYFKGLVVAELLFQLPLLIANAYAFIAENLGFRDDRIRVHKTGASVSAAAQLLIATSYAFIAGKDWGRITGVIYSTHVATTMFPIFADILAKKVPTQNLLIGIYAPYLIIPLIMLARLATQQHPFTEVVPRISKARKGE